MKEEKKQEMSLIEQRMRRTAKLLREGKRPTLTGLVGLLPRKDKKSQKNLENSESKE